MHIMCKIVVFISSIMVCYNTIIKIGKEKCYEKEKDKMLGTCIMLYGIIIVYLWMRGFCQ